jgi:hypothetical protein
MEFNKITIEEYKSIIHYFKIEMPDETADIIKIGKSLMDTKLCRII